MIKNTKEEIEIVKFDGFPVKKEDADRLNNLKQKMIMKGRSYKIYFLYYIFQTFQHFIYFFFRRSTKRNRCSNEIRKEKS